MTSRSLLPWLSRASIVVLLVASACGDDDSSDTDAGPTAGKSGSSGKGGSGGNGGKGGSGTAGRTSTSGTNGGGTAGLGGGMLMCLEDPPTDPVKCGDETCSAPSDFAMNPCVVPCCVKVDGKDVCASKSTTMGFEAACTLPAVADPACPDLEGMGMPFKGCCNAEKKKCGFISTLRPGCITESSVVTLPDPLVDCTPPDTGSDDAGMPDAG